MNEKCHVVNRGSILELHSPYFCYKLDKGEGLRPISWENSISGESLLFDDGYEINTSFDRCQERIGITGWRIKETDAGGIAPDLEKGYAGGYFDLIYDDIQWEHNQTPCLLTFNENHQTYRWCRSHVFFPEALKGYKICITLGGFGLFDYRYMRVFINGKELGVRTVKERWHEPGCFFIYPEDDLYPYVNFGGDNVIAMQLQGFIERTEKLDSLDPNHTKELTIITNLWPAQFEQYVIFGDLPENPLWAVKGYEVSCEGENAELTVKLDAGTGLYAEAVYNWNSSEPVLLKELRIKNASAVKRVLLDVSLWYGKIRASVSDGEQGFPVYINGSFFAAIEHPSGWAKGQNGSIYLKQYPGKGLEPGKEFVSMKAMFGVSEKEQSNKAFTAYVVKKMRRMNRKHDRAICIYESFGSWKQADDATIEDTGHYSSTQEYILSNIEKFGEGYNEQACSFDYYAIEFWHDHYGDAFRADPKRFPQGLGVVKEKLNDYGVALGLWLDSSTGNWTIGGNPVVSHCRTREFARYSKTGIMTNSLCRAEDPFRTMYENAFVRNIKENNVMLIKQDNLMCVCHNPYHSHMPGIYSTEAIHSSVIDAFRKFDQADNDVFIMLYWGYRSPWWLLHADTLFDKGLAMEAASPTSSPSLYMRDGVTLGLDQATQWCEDVPALGKDSLGVWCSDWGWNSSIGKERWQEGIIMDICRGSAMLQLWSDEGYLSIQERIQLGIFIKLLRDNTDCFMNSKAILGDPWKEEPYGYCCSNGGKAFFAINNCTWSFKEVILKLGPDCGLSNMQRWRLYRWYPQPSRLVSNGCAEFEQDVKIILKPFEVILIEAISDSSITVDHHEFSDAELLVEKDDIGLLKLAISEDSELSQLVTHAEKMQVKGSLNLEGFIKRTFQISTSIPESGTYGMIYLSAKIKKGEQVCQLKSIGRYFSAAGNVKGKKKEIEPVAGYETYPMAWQAWRAGIDPKDAGKDFHLTVSAVLPKEVRIEFECRYIRNF